MIHDNPLDDRFTRAMAAIDSANAEDANRATFEGREYPAELLYAMRMTEWLTRLAPDASEALRLAARAQHIRRWLSPRSDYPMTRPGYHQWRTALGRFHADEAGKILLDAGYETDAVTRIQSLIRKEKLKSDPETQTLEDVACLVFLEIDYVDFAGAHADAKVIDILAKTWRKMSDEGHRAALQLAVQLPERERRLVEQAVSGRDATAHVPVRPC